MSNKNCAAMSLEDKINQINQKRLPRHVAIIMDGNGRWARQRNLDRSMGHMEGVNTVRRITEIASDIGVKYLTLYTFSTENWNRPKEEVDGLMHLIAIAIERETPGLVANNVKLRIIGDLSRIPDFALDRLRNCENVTSACSGMTLALAISYSARWEMTQAAQRLAHAAIAKQITPEQIDETMFSNSLTTAGMPDPDLLIRTGGDYRISNYLLWQIAYSELFFTDVFWPDFTKDHFCDAILQYQSRERRFGKTSEQIRQI